MTSPKSRYKTLDAWRGAACLMIVVFHAVIDYVATPSFEQRLRSTGGSAADWGVYVASRLWVGVPIFFVISGYCIAAAADSARSKPRGAATFFARRLRRIYPPLWAYLALAALVVALLPEDLMPGTTERLKRPLYRPQDLGAWHWFGSITLTEWWRPHVVGPKVNHFTGQLWSLCYEEQFYAVTALGVALAPRRLFAAFALVTAVVFANVFEFSALLPPESAARFARWQQPLAGCFFDGMWLAFAAGVAVYYRGTYATPTLRLALDGFLATGAVWLAGTLASPWAFKASTPGYIFVAFLAALALGHLRRFDAATAAAWPLAPLRFCGRMCYSLYLVHAPIALVLASSLHSAGVQSSAATLAVTVPAVVLTSVAASYPFYWYVERRFLNPPLPPEPAQRDAATT